MRSKPPVIRAVSIKDIDGSPEYDYNQARPRVWPTDHGVYRTEHYPAIDWSALFTSWRTEQQNSSRLLRTRKIFACGEIMFGDLLNKLFKKKKKKGFHPGHYYSPIPDLEGIKAREKEIWAEPSGKVDGINLNAEAQLRLVHEFQKFYEKMPFREQKQPGLRFYFKNGCYSYTDAIFLYGMINHLRPRRIIEIGAGFSSAVILDTNELFFDNSIDCLFIEPFPERFLSLISEEDKRRIKLIKNGLQDVDLGIFSTLQANDILFVDSTHVSKIGSDVNTIFFKILPALNKGVYVHFHDIFYPFEYPKDWVYDEIFWNEAYILRAFLQYNEAFEITLFSHYLHIFHREVFEKKLPLCLKNPGGDIWIKKL